MHLNKFIVFVLIFGLALKVQSQNLGLSSYSRIGIGDLAETGSSRNNGMGGAGVASYNQFQVNALNPAALAVLKYTNFEFDLVGKRTRYLTSKDIAQTGLTGNIQYISLAFPLHKRVNIQIGAKPFSSIAYKDADQQAARDNNNNPINTKFYNNTSTGSGGLSDFFLGGAYNYKDWLLLGVNAGIVMGQSVYENRLEDVRKSIFVYTTERFEQHLRISPGILITREIKNNKADLLLTDTLVGFKDSLGFQKKAEVIPTTTNWFYGFGLTGSIFKTLQASEFQKFDQAAYSTVRGSNGYYYSDYVYYKRDTIRDGKLGNYSLPASLRVGLSLYQPNKLSFALDYNFANWSKFTYNQYHSKPVNQHGLALGTEFIPDFNSTKYYKRVAYRGGIKAEMLPYEIAGQKISQIQATLGAGLVFAKTGVTLNVAIAYGERGTVASNLVKENYWLATVGIISNSKWFVRRRHD
ncbi:MAG: hypothetical protein H7329_03175 [Opitutaceae bacterium]|nr:hypothetical protein [Cytophagales bacterium]